MPPHASPARRSYGAVLAILALIVLPQAVTAVPGLSSTDPVELAAAQVCLDYARKAPTSTTAAGVPVSNAGYNGGATLVMALAVKNPSLAQDTSPAKVAARSAALLTQLRQSISATSPSTPRCAAMPNSTTDPALDRESASEPTAAGGAAAADDLWLTSMAVVARTTPAVWGALSAQEQQRLDLIMEGELVSNAFVMSDTNPLFQAQAPERTIDGLTNVGRDWNPAYTRGAMLSNIALAGAYFGPNAAATKLAAWATTPGTRRANFLVEVTKLRLDNLKETFGGGTQRSALPWWSGGTTPVVIPTNPPNANPGAPTDAQIKTALTGWTYTAPGAATGSDGDRVPVTDPMRLYQAVVNYSYDRPVSCGLAGGNGIAALPSGATPVPVPAPGTAGRLANVADCSKLPFPPSSPTTPGPMGMLHDFDSREVAGTTDQSLWRSSALSAVADMKAELPAQIGLLASGLWKHGAIGSGGQTGHDLMALKTVGVSDLFSKLSLGYMSVALGKATLSPGNSPDYVQRLAQPGSYEHGYDYLYWLWNRGVQLSAQINPLPMPSQSAIATAISQTQGSKCFDYGRQGQNLLTTPSTTPVKAVSENDESKGAGAVLAVAAYNGDAAATAALKRQLTFTLKDSGTAPDPSTNCSESVGGGASNPAASASNEPTAQGGLSSQHELWAAVTFVIAKRTPAIWDWLSDTQRAKIDLIMQGILVSNAYLTSDKNPQILAGPSSTPPQHSVDGNGNVQRFWGPNYRNGMFGSLLVAEAYFGEQQAINKLETWTRQSYLAEARALKLSNLEFTFTPHSIPGTTPPSTTPTDAEITSAIRGWKATPAGGPVLALGKPMEMFRWLSDYTFDGTVSCGLAHGAGAGATTPAGIPGRVVSSITSAMPTTTRDSTCQALLGPSFGQLGMLHEFDSGDVDGVRSSWHYSYMGFKADLATQLGMLAGYVWAPGTIAGSTPTTTAALWNRRSVGKSDLYAKLGLGYLSYSKGKADPNPGAVATSPTANDWVLNRMTATTSRYGQALNYNESLWDSVLGSSPDGR